MPYVNTFGGTQVNVAQPSLRQVTLTADQVLVWPRFNYNSSDVVADQLVVDATIAGLDFNMPEANLGSVGFATLFTNVGLNDFDVNDDSGTLIATVVPSQAVYITMLDNSDADGEWMALQFAVGSSAVTAAALAGAGLQAITGLLTTAWPMTSTAVTPVTISSTTTRSRLINWTGGAGVANLPAVAGMAQYFFSVKNSGTGSLVLTPAAGLIDGAATKSVGVGESFIVLTDGANWFTIGNRLQFTATRIAIDLTGTGVYTLGASEQGFLIYEFFGVLSGDRSVRWPAAVAQAYIYNNTSGSFDVTIQTTALGLDFDITQGNNVVSYTDGTNFYQLIDSAPLDEGKVAILAELFG